MPNRDPQDGNFCPYLTAMKDTYSIVLSCLAYVINSFYLDANELLIPTFDVILEVGYD